MMHLRPRWRDVPVVLVSIAAAGVYLNALRNGYALDDVLVVQHNPRVHGLSNMRDILFGPYWWDPPALYRPVTLLSFATEWALFGDNPMVFHLVNVVVHALVVAVLYLLLVRMGAARLGAVAGALLFAVHPVHVEAVANIVGRAELLAALFFLLACHLHITHNIARSLRFAGVGACYLIALGAKESAVTLPAVLVLLDAFRDREGRVPGWQFARRDVPLYLILGAALGGYLVLRVQAIGETLGAGTAAYMEGLSTSQRLATAVRLWPEFARLLFWPAELSAEWGPALIYPATWTHPLVFVGLMLGAAVAVLVITSWSRERWISLAILWFAVTILPMSQIFFPIGVMVAERTLYLPSVAVALLAPAAVAWLRTRQTRVRTAVLAGFFIVLGLGAWRSWHRTPTWESNSAMIRALFWEHPSSFRALWLGGEMALGQGRPAEAVLLLKEAVELTSGRLYRLNMTLAGALLAAEQPEEAERFLRTWMRMFPVWGEGYLYLAESFLLRGRYDDAIAVLREGYTTATDTAYHRLSFTHGFSLAHDGTGMLDSALVWRQRSLRTSGARPLFQEWYHLARLRQLLNQPQFAKQALDSARAAAPLGVRDSLVLEPLPAPNSPLLRAFGTAAAERPVRY